MNKIGTKAAPSAALSQKMEKGLLQFEMSNTGAAVLYFKSNLSFVAPIKF